MKQSLLSEQHLWHLELHQNLPVTFFISTKYFSFPLSGCLSKAFIFLYLDPLGLSLQVSWSAQKY